jgi:hypothetical protein
VDLKTEAGWGYPFDPSSAGTWIGINQWGLLLTLLNEYPSASSGPAPKSRGLLIPAALSSATLEEAASRITAQEPSQFGACLVALVAPRGEIVTLRLDRKIWHREAHPRQPMIFASSSLDAEKARTTRQELFQKALPGGIGVLRAMHRRHEPEKGPYSVCMHREGSQSVSFSEVSMDGRGVELFYWPGSPCETAGNQPRRISFPLREAPTHA